MKLWIVGKNLDYNSSEWLIIGVCDSEEAAVAACTNEFMFVGPLTLNEILSEEPEVWPGFYRPLLEPGERQQ